MYAIEKPATTKSILPTVGVTVTSIALTIGAIMLTNYAPQAIGQYLVPWLIENGFSETVTLESLFGFSLADFLLITQLAVISTLAIYVARQWLKALVPSLPSSVCTALKLLAYGTALTLPVIVTGGFYFILISESASCLETEPGAGIESIIVCAANLILSIAVVAFIIKKTHSKSDFLCEASLAALACFSPLPIIAGALILMAIMLWIAWKVFKLIFPLIAIVSYIAMNNTGSR